MKTSDGIKLNGEWGRKCAWRMFYSFFAGVFIGMMICFVAYDIFILN